ncbi:MULTISPECIES: ATP-binding cassette domain-containing protein [Rhizobium/Agrobacterium group]|uniref:thiamine ABC transporter ATP-binding protein n=1 Tax=Rhizobium/Agrobacterium group TaxID=227290 RepID=UPI000FDCC4F0|nr:MULTISPECIES: ATP-binding cassette domain-containing protein [Rhizobium/Agrobacterium group]MBB4403347.1 thiamine transport system ATP-binding protein [Agrobacterium radiobacter]MBB5589512.1 thiamine transport system ATP-binding protein [Agrobacterium radiobacter]NTB95336.1 ATP-binding cassette domain-containing protein [Agrobacterium tumefaciens]NTC45201.1 ATP-binding cassette domain-containing protein [Agrobacterium tumefaciens]RVT77991.1 ATP-binding cassette domain-containing protein [Ag
MTGDDFAVELDKVRLRLGTQDFDLDCTFPQSRIIAVVGASGSGKSTLLNLVAGFEAPDSGRVMIGGQDMTALDPSERPVSSIFQDNNLFAHLDIFTNVALGVSPGLKLRLEDRERIEMALARVGLAGFDKRLPGTLSGGERQRAALARALVRKKPVMLLDEPFAALDPGLRAGMTSLLLDLHGETKNTVIIVTHHPEDIKKLAQQVVFLDRGRVVYVGSNADFFATQNVKAVDSFLNG